MSSPLKSYDVIDRDVDNKTSCSTVPADKSPDMKELCALMGQLDLLEHAIKPKQNSNPNQSPSLKKSRKILKNGDIRDWLVAGAKTSEGVDKKKCKLSQPQKVDVKKIKSPITEFPKYETHMRNLKKPKSQQEKLHCKHLTLDEVREALDRHLSYAEKIQSEEIYCERHATFWQQERGANFDEFVDLVGSDTSTESFTDEHIQEMLRMLAKKFGDKRQYYLVVLLPELCLKIFMEVHNMSQEEALKYLEERRFNDDLDSD